MSDPKAELQALVHACLDGRATKDDESRLNTLLRADAAARDLYLQLADTHSCLAIDEQLWVRSAPVAVKQKPRWLGAFFARPLTAAAAGIMVGLFSASMVFAYVTPHAGKVITLLQESFESGSAPQVTGVPVDAGVWSGDYTEVTGEQQGVRAESGSKMLRLLRADFAGKPKPEGSYIGEVFRLIDMRPYRQVYGDGGAVVQLSAAFNALAFSADEKYECNLTICALDAETAANGSMRNEDALFRNPIAAASTGRMVLDRNPLTWQKAAGELRLPLNTEFLLICIGVQHAVKSQRKVTFAGHYIDDVRLSLARRAPLL